MRITIIGATALPGVLHLDAEKIQFSDGGDEYTLEEIRTVMRSRRWHHTRKLDMPYKPTDNES